MTMAAGRPTAMTLRELLVASTPGHRRVVASTLGLDGGDAADVARALHDDRRLAELIGGLSPAAGAAAGALAFDDAAGLGHPGQGPSPATLSGLERHGLAFAFGTGWTRRWAMPEDLRPRVRRLRAEARARPLARGSQATPRRPAGAPLQCGHDAAALWAYLARTPVRVKADGEVYARAWPKLEGALPPISGIDADGFAAMRVDLALEFLRAGGFLRLRSGGRPGQETRRDLAADGDLAGALAREPDLADARLTRLLARGAHGVAADLAAALPGRTVGLEAFGSALRELLDEAGDRAWSRHAPGTLTLSALGPLWLTGTVQLEVDAQEAPVAVHVVPASAAPAEGPLGVCQSSFEVVCLRPPTPAERAVLTLAAEPVAGQAHVFRITRTSVCALARTVGRERVRGALEGLIGALPQNVERSVADWVAGVRSALRMRSALFVEAPDAETAQALAAGPLAGLVVERLGERGLAVSGRSLTEVERVLGQAGHELEPGLDRVSGTWLDRHDGSGEARGRWAPGDLAPPRPTTSGKLVSTLATRSAPSAPHPPRSAAERGLVVEVESLAAVLTALEEERDLDIVYAGRRGLTRRRITPLEIEGPALRAWCHLRGDDRSFWLASIHHAEPAGR